MNFNFTKEQLIRNLRKKTACLLLILSASIITFSADAQTQTIVQKHGQLRVSGNKIVDKNGTVVQLRGMSMYWSQWYPKYYNYNAIKWLRDDWKITVVRAAIAGGTAEYTANPQAEKDKLFKVVDAAIALGIYVIIDWHDHEAHLHEADAQAFFREMSKKYGASPNVIYEIWNEPLEVSWASTIKPYHQRMVTNIRTFDPDNIIICGTRSWSQHVEEPAASPVTGSNIAYTLHYYAASHGEWLRTRTKAALDAGIAIFVTEYGTTEASGKGVVSEAESKLWWAFLDNHSIGHANWSVADIPESSAALVSGASADGGWTASQLKLSGTLVRNELRAKAQNLNTSVLANGTYRITARHSGKVFDVEGRSTAPTGGNVVQYTYGGATNQQWYVKSLGNGFYSIRAVHSTQALDVSGWKTENGTDVNTYPFNGSNVQKWRIENEGNGYYRITSGHSGKSIDIPGSSLANSVSINQWTYGGGTNQQFAFGWISNTTMAANTDTEQLSLLNNPEITENNSFSVFPNPVDDKATVVIPPSMLNGSITLLNSAGIVIYSGVATHSQHIINMSGMPAGLYIVNVKLNKESLSTKIIKK